MQTHWSKCGRGPRTREWLPASAGILRCDRYSDNSYCPSQNSTNLQFDYHSRFMCTGCSISNHQIYTRPPLQSSAHPTRAHVHVHTLVSPLVSPCPLQHPGDPRPPPLTDPPSAARQRTCEGVDAGLFVQGGRLALDAVFVLPVPALDEVCLRLQSLRVDAGLHLRWWHTVNMSAETVRCGKSYCKRVFAGAGTH